MSNIKHDKYRQSIARNLTILGTVQLSNPSDTEATIADVITYKYPKSVYYGTAEGVARGLPTKVIDNVTVVEIPDGWGMEYTVDITQVG